MTPGGGHAPAHRGRRGGRAPLTTRIGRWSANHPWLAITAWLCFVLAGVVGGSLVGTVEATTQDSLHGELARADRIEQAGKFPEPPAAESVLITARAGELDLDRARAVATDLSARMRALTDVAKVADPVVSPSRQAVLVEVKMAGSADDADARVGPLLEATAQAQQQHPDLRVEQVGSGSLSKALTETLAADFVKAELISVPVALVILLFSFGALIAAGVPVVLALSAVAGAMGLAQFASHIFPAGEMVNSIILLIGMAVGVDYSLFYLRREREERARGRDHRSAVEIAARTSGHAVLVSGVAVMVAMASLFLVGDNTFSSMATGSILVVGVAMIGSLTVLPAILVVLGRWVDRPRVPFLGRRIQRAERSRFWAAVLRPALRAPLATFVVSVGVLVVVAVPALGMNLKRPTLTDLPRSIPILHTYDRLAQAFPGNELGTSHLVAIRTGGAGGPAVEREITDLAALIKGDGRFAQDRPPTVRRSADGTVFLATVRVTGTSDSHAAAESLHRLRAELLPQTVGTVPDTEWAVAGRTANDADFRDRMADALPGVVAFVLAMTFLVMLITFRSVVVAMTSILLNAISVAASYGLLVLVFQHTWAEDLLGFTSNGAIVSWLPLMLFVILFGLSMDYHVFVVSRIREAVQQGLSTREAIEQGIVSSASTVSSAAIIMVAVFCIFATLSVVEFKQLGVGLAAAILIDATIIRAVVLPSLMRLLGEANWWAPRFIAGPRRTAVADADRDADTQVFVAAVDR
ncbi:putative drug exporter of the RND superfamily [Micromonospora citrea]|uniref:Putative drug exporter of the RND superfamily n=1 Tax=Micromonospora citrea TaxID=47855 RepID=A0A1C6UKI2_9ACTN|nr:MMPL family transporter [Micromonospora citrea]SCL54399.1 putative drug exporter of the RND superfamily [Micromonospora citrea]